MKENPAAINVCIPEAVRAMLIAQSMGHILSDNALFNFGMGDSNVVIIDAGSRPKEPKMNKTTFNRTVMKRFWTKTQTLVKPAELKVYRDQWGSAGWDIDTALQTYETRWQDLLNDARSLSVLNSLERRNSTQLHVLMSLQRWIL